MESTEWMLDNVGKHWDNMTLNYDLKKSPTRKESLLYLINSHDTKPQLKTKLN